MPTRPDAGEVPTLASLGLLDLVDETARGELTARGWREIGEGHFATVFVHDGHPGIAVRVGSCMDGWALYGLGLWKDRLDDVRFAPRVFDMALVDGDGYVALTERLRRPETDAEEALVASISRFMGETFGEIDDVGAVPGLASFAIDLRVFLGKSYLDPREGNVLFAADGTPIVNDPCGRIFGAEIRDEILAARNGESLYFVA